MKRVYLVLITVFCCGALWGQCPLGSVNLPNQYSINDFVTNYPNCTDILGSLTIGYYSVSNITDLRGLSQLETIQGDLSIRNNDSLYNLLDLENIISIGGNLYIQNNDNLNLAGLEDITISGNLEIFNNNKLTNFTNLENLNLGGGLSIANNNNLTSLTGLEHLTTINGHLSIIYNDTLMTLEGLENLESIGGDLIFHNNNRLSNLSNLGQLHIIRGDMAIGPEADWTLDYSTTTLNGLQSLDTIVGSLILRRNTNLTNLIGLENLEYIGKSIKLHNNTSLNNLSGLENLNTLQDSLSIFNNNALINLSAIGNINLLGVSNLSIHDNENLSICNTTNICSYLEDDGSAQIYNNAPDCNSIAQLIFICSDIMPCLSEGIIFSTQQQIDSFAISYPSCEAIAGNIIIQGNSPTAITSLNGLSQIAYINGTLTIQDNETLINLSGLELLSSATGGLDINNNDALLNLHALSNLTDVQGELIIRNNAVLTKLNGIHNIVGSAIEYLNITDNPILWGCSVESTCNYFFGGSEIDNSYHQMATVVGNVAGNYNVGPICGNVNEVIARCPQYLPIELTTFQAQIQQKTTLLTWQTATETHNSGFEIQRSKDGTTWEKIGWQDGQGNSQTAHDYTYRDENPLFGTSYYRLQQIDFDGTSSYSDIVKVDYVATGISIHPNPVKNTLHIADLNDNTIRNITISDQMGRQVIRQNTNTNTLDVSKLSSGVYIIQVVLDSGVFSDKFVVK